MKVDLSFAIQTVLCLAVAYQQCLILNLQSADESMMKQFLSNANIKIAAQTVKSASTSTVVNPTIKRRLQSNGDTFLQAKSPAPVVPAFQEPAKDERTMGANKGGGHSIYGGAGDEVHLGGFTERDNNTISFNLWNYMLGPMAVKSIVDIGCGRGFSTKYFKDNGAKVLCVEGSHDAIKHSFLEKSDIVQHDYTKGVWWPEETYDVAWSTEFLEHLGRQHMRNYMATLKQTAFVFFSVPGGGGYHHVEVHGKAWWITRFQALGLLYSRELTELIQAQVVADGHLHPRHGSALTGLQVFINPRVASLPKHAHLMGGNGCFSERRVINNRDNGAICTGVDALPTPYQSLLECNKYHWKKGDNFDNLRWNCVRNQAVSAASVAATATTKRRMQ